MASTKAVVATLTTKCANKTSVACVVNGTTEVDVPLSSSSSSFYVPNGVEYIEYFPSQPTTIYVEGDVGSKVNRLNPDLTVDHKNTPLKVQSLSFRYQKLTEAVNFVKWPASLRSLDLTGNDIHTMNQSFSVPPKLQVLSVSTNEMTTFDTVTLPESLQSINLDINDYDVFNVDAPTFIVLKNASVYTDRIIRPTAACTGTKQTFNGTPFPPSKFSKPTSALLHTACVVAPVAATTDATTTPPGSATAAAKDNASSSSSSLGMIVGLAAAGIVVVGLVGLFIVLRQRRNNTNSRHFKPTTAILGETHSDHNNVAAEYHIPTTSKSSSDGSNHPLANGTMTSGDGNNLSKYNSSSQYTNGSSNYNQDASTFAYRYDIRGDADLINFRIPKRELQNRSVCGSGGFATVYRATFHDQVVAVKELTASMHAQHRHIQAFMHEIKLHATLNHGNIVRFIGASWTTLNDLAVVSEFMSEGDLRDFLARDAVSQHLPWFQPSTQQEGRGQFCTKLSLAVNLADAVTYLHSFDPPILHRDLKSRNVLLSDTFTAKLTDFGISRELADDTMTSEAGTAAWTAPEVLTNNGHYNEKADMYSFGVVLSELDTWQIPYSSTSSQSSNGPNGYSNVQMAMLVAAGKLAPSFRSDCPPEVLALARACLSMDPDSRPTASIVAYELRRLQSAKLTQQRNE
ncbi:TKL protein kinase, variant 1 [Aphanomyces astaci]|uniref:TKL protein kinase, variant 1 n=1 Tax=Aphanomyces astaci TaxID=112090 RepID=W4GFQ6_APHAT|nr:TKL protein kinase, variant 1 [Aphanomyces astaci]ETV78071.1 TKL protein kinase, variant 1 [Aphanomyces astaci]|eukprot:XP_009832409.1 TKL protein kinase, variant 1 [Aphanomyces astaci]